MGVRHARKHHHEREQHHEQVNSQEKKKKKTSLPLCFFWDLQNCAVPSKSSPYECVNKIRGVVPKGEKTVEVSFNAYADTSSLSQEVRQEFSRRASTFETSPVKNLAPPIFGCCRTFCTTP